MRLENKFKSQGKQVALIERKSFGGTCVNTGCIPTKTLIASAHAAYLARHTQDFGININCAINVNMPHVKARKDAIEHDEIVLSPVAQHLARTPLKLIIVVYSLMVSCFIYLDLREHTFSAVLKQVCFGLLSWTLVEYFVHRFVFHGTSKNIKVRKFRYFIYGYHHDKPTDLNRLVLPFVITFPIIIFSFTMTFILLGTAWTSIVAGFTMGYIIYDMTHYAIHRFNPTSRFGKFFKRYHFYHHFKDHDHCYGVKSPFWDYPFQTHKNPPSR